MKSRNSYAGLDPVVVGQIRFRARRLKRQPAMRHMEIEDIEQELVLDLYARKHAFNPNLAKWSTFVDRIMANKCVSLLEAEYTKKRGSGIGTVSLDELLEMPNGDQFEPVDEVASNITPIDMRIDTARAIENLPDRLKHLACSLAHQSMTELSRNGAVGRSQHYVDLARLKRQVAPLATYLH